MRVRLVWLECCCCPLLSREPDLAGLPFKS